ncbi:hypothetical protein ABKN59_011027 [Abortiporus biennis]
MGIDERTVGVSPCDSTCNMFIADFIIQQHESGIWIVFFSAPSICGAASTKSRLCFPQVEMVVTCYSSPTC